MNLQKIKQIPITQILNIQAEKTEFLIRSPFRNEKTPSFKINTQKNLWYDFGTGEGGTNIDLIMRLKNCDTKQAINFLKKIDTTSFSFSPAISPAPKTEAEIKKIQDLQNQALLDYLKKRKISLNIAKKYLKEIYYLQNGKNYFSLAFKNDKGGFETRNSYFKGCIGQKSITTIDNANIDTISVFEGFMDFLSAIIHFGKMPKSNIIILNSLSLLPLLKLEKYKNILIFLDNDNPGKKATNFLTQENKNKNVLDMSYIYKDFKDFNEFIKQKN